MTSQSIEFTDDIDFLLVRAKHRWSRLYCFVEKQLFELTLSEIFEDPVESLIECCSALIQGADSYILGLKNEPHGYRFSILRDSQNPQLINITLEEMRDWDFKLPPVDLYVKFTVKESQFLDIFYHQFCKLSKLSRCKSYTEERTKFPKKAFGRFKAQYEKQFAKQEARATN